ADGHAYDWSDGHRRDYARQVRGEACHCYEDLRVRRLHVVLQPLGVSVGRDELDLVRDAELGEYLRCLVGYGLIALAACDHGHRYVSFFCRHRNQVVSASAGAPDPALGTSVPSSP